MKNILIICAIAIGFTACEKPAGEGGTSVIEGELAYFEITFNSTTLQNDTHFYPKAGKDIFIIYSDDEGSMYDDKFETNYNGKYHFEYLRKGDYTIYLNKDTTISTGPNSDYSYDIPVFKHIKITDNNSVNTVPDFIIDDN
jgi:hypothetical protein